eukprot:253062-Pelagomonas_calceolata.AAC.2
MLGNSQRALRKGSTISADTEKGTHAVAEKASFPFERKRWHGPEGIADPSMDWMLSPSRCCCAALPGLAVPPTAFRLESLDIQHQVHMALISTQKLGLWADPGNGLTVVSSRAPLALANLQAF